MRWPFHCRRQKPCRCAAFGWTRSVRWPVRGYRQVSIDGPRPPLGVCPGTWRRSDFDTTGEAFVNKELSQGCTVDSQPDLFLDSHARRPSFGCLTPSLPFGVASGLHLRGLHAGPFVHDDGANEADVDAQRTVGPGAVQADENAEADACPSSRRDKSQSGKKAWSLCTSLTTEEPVHRSQCTSYSTSKRLCSERPPSAGAPRSPWRASAWRWPDGDPLVGDDEHGQPTGASRARSTARETPR